MIRTTDGGGSILAKLRNVSVTYPNVPKASMLLLYAQQGILGRLDASPYGEHFVLKGALSLFTRYGDAARPTEDIDLAAHSMGNTSEEVMRIMQDVCRVPFGDGLEFDPDTVQVRVINDMLEYPGVHVTLTASLGPSRVRVPIDVSFGNVITPAPVVLSFPQLLIPTAVRVVVYPLETVVTEKFAALVEIGSNTTRMKDVYDLHVILGRESFDAAILGQALRRSFAARHTPVADVPATLSDEFASDALLSNRWEQYKRRTRVSAPDFRQVMAEVRSFFSPVFLGGQTSGRWDSQHLTWFSVEPSTDDLDEIAAE
ncbi:nucleotidyl transferase AbiEii/AbiGii toxin family protein [Deinococcus sp. UYEF24]